MGRSRCWRWPGGSERWARQEEVTECLRRVKGVSRIDQAKKVIGGFVHEGSHSWFVRVYEGTKPRRTCSFSDASAGGRRAALRAAAFHAAHLGARRARGLSLCKELANYVGTEMVVQLTESPGVIEGFCLLAIFC